jgi:hypothetical protein
MTDPWAKCCPRLHFISAVSNSFCKPLVTCLPRLSRSSLGLSDHQCPATTTDMAKATPTPISVAGEFHRLGDV